MRSCVGIAVTLTVFLLAGCDAGDRGGSGVVIDTLPNGAVRVHNPAKGMWDEGEEWRLVEELRLGGVDAEGPELFGNVPGLVIDDYARIHVLDGDAGEIRVFDDDGRHVRTYAGSGAGPGELRTPFRLASRGGEVWVADPGNRRHAVFDTSGAVLEAIPRNRPVPVALRFDEDDRLWEITTSLEPDGPSRIVLRYDDEMSPVDTLRLPGDFGHRAPFAPHLVYTLAPSDYIWAGYNADYRVAKMTFDGDTVLLIEREYEPVPVTDGEREEALEKLEWLESQGQEARMPDTRPPYERLAVDEDGRAWVVRDQPDDLEDLGAGIRFDVFDADGLYLGPVESSAIFRVGPIFRGDRVYGTDIDSLGVTYVVRARIERRRP